MDKTLVSTPGLRNADRLPAVERDAISTIPKGSAHQSSELSK